MNCYKRHQCLKGIEVHLQYFDFVFIDDLGKEFIGREYNPSSVKWAEGKLFEILNARYNALKPTIFSSNYSIGELASVLGFDKGIVERINEMATRTIKLEGDDFREIALKEKSELAKQLGIQEGLCKIIHNLVCLIISLMMTL